MRRPAWTLRDAVLFWSVLGVCATAYLAHLDALASGHLAWPPVTFTAARPNQPPRVAFVRPDAPESLRTELEPGHAVAALQGRSLRGEGGLEAALLLYAEAARATQGRLALERVKPGGRHARVEATLVPIPHAWRASALALSFLAVGALTYRRATRHPAARLFFLAAAGYALHWSYFFGGGDPARNALAIAVFGLGVAVAAPLALLSVLALPEDVAAHGRSVRLLAWAFAVLGLGATTWGFGGPLPAATGQPLTVGTSVVFLLCLAALLVDRWRRTGAIGRRKLKWILCGGLLAFLPPVFAGLAAVARPEWAWFYEVSLVSLVLLPIGVFVAIERDHLLDVDRLLSATMLVSILGVVLLAAVIGAVPRIAYAADDWIDPRVSQPALAVASAVAVLGLHARLKPWIQARLFPEREALEAGAAELRGDLAACEKPSELFDALGGGLARRLHLSTVVVYGRAHDVFAPLFDRGDAIAPTFAVDGPLAELLVDAPRVVDLGTLAVRIAGEPGAQAERAGLESIGTELVLPIVCDGVLEGVVCLGEKRSGERFDGAELALLQSIADKVADELRRFDLEQVHREEREMVRLLRGYVPAVVAERLAKRVDMAPGEVDVTLLFVDLRGYTRLSQQHGPAATFSLVSRYTDAVSSVIDDHGGAVVDFQGDGLMAVFGAPEPLAHKERAAVSAALAIVDCVRALRIDPDDPASGTADLGIGIASGHAYAGPIRTVDRTIWGVLGDTTNLAARLQTLSRELDASVVVDGATHASASDLMQGFVRHAQRPIPGRHGHIDLFALPRRPDAAIHFQEDSA